MRNLKIFFTLICMGRKISLIMIKILVIKTKTKTKQEFAYPTRNKSHVVFVDDIYIQV